MTGFTGLTGYFYVFINLQACRAIALHKRSDGGKKLIKHPGEMHFIFHWAGNSPSAEIITSELSLLLYINSISKNYPVNPVDPV